MTLIPYAAPYNQANAYLSCSDHIHQNVRQRQTLDADGALRMTAIAPSNAILKLQQRLQAEEAKTVE